MKGCTAKAPCVVTTIQELVYCAVHHSALPPKAIADSLGVRTGYLLDSANPDRDEVQFQLRLFLPLLKATDRADLFEAFSTLAGFVAFTPPSGIPTHDMVRETARAMREFADFIDSTGAAIADGQVTLCEARRLAQYGERVMGRIASLVASGQRAATIGPVTLAREERAS